MVRLRDLLDDRDRIHLDRILGLRDDPAAPETRRRFRVSELATQDLYVEEASRGPFRALSADDRERLLSDVVWRLTCHVEGSAAPDRGAGVRLESGFRLDPVVENGRSGFCLAKEGGL